MADEIEAMGGLATGALLAREIDRPHAAPRHAIPAAANCCNCGATLLGHFCHHCGQSAHVHRTLGAVVHEFAHGVLHVDGKLWRTLPLLVFNPGRLTRDYTHGRRARYLAPLGLYLFIVLLTFLVFGFTGGAVIGGDRAADIARADSALSAARADRDRIMADPRATAADHAAARAKVAAAQTARDEADTDVLADIRIGSESGELEVKGAPSLERKLRHLLANPELALYKLQQKAYKLSFLLIPMSLPALWLVFAWRRGVTLYDHSVFILYSLSFMALFVCALVLLSLGGAATGGAVALAAVTVPPVHLYAQLKGAYRLSTRSALWRTAVLLVAGFFILALYIALLVAIGVVI